VFLADALEYEIRHSLPPASTLGQQSLTTIELSYNDNSYLTSGCWSCRLAVRGWIWDQVGEKVSEMHTWDPRDYECHSAAQESWARDCLGRLRLRGDEQILDIGCGDGRVSADLAELVPAGAVLAIDASPEMIAHACEKHLTVEGANLDFAVADATDLACEDRFDLVVSFNCLHWVRDQAAMLAGVVRALVPGGRTFLHFAGQGNVAGMVSVVGEVAARDAWRPALADLPFPWCFPDADSYRALVEAAGLVPERVELLERQMAHQDATALAGWLRTTWLPYLDRLPADRREAFVDDVVGAYVAVRPTDEQGLVWVDAVRLEVEARRA
jgi:trans-aconitate 2-methyltransferase